MIDKLHGFFAFFGELADAIMRKLYPVASTDNQTSIKLVQAPPPQFDFSTPKAAYHSTRVLCDNAGLSVDEKNLICACIYQESQFHNDARNYNRSSKGAILSTDWGLCQVNDFYHIGKGKDFPSVDYVLQNPDKVVKWMISMYEHGMLKQWVSYSSGAYKKWLLPVSPMWLLG